MPTKLRVIPRPAQNTRVIIAPTAAPAIASEGRLSYACGKCETILIQNVAPNQVRGVVIKCPACGSYNESP